MSGHDLPRRGFTLVELLIVIGIIGLLMSLLMPAISSARAAARKAECLNNLHQIGVAIYNYANDYEGSIPYGPKDPDVVAPANFYTSTGVVTFIISGIDGKPVGLGLLLQRHLARQLKVLFCPGSDYPVSAEAEMARVGHTQAQCGYYYRHASGVELYDDPDVPLPPPDHILLSNLGNNRRGKPIRALVMDAQFLSPDLLASSAIHPNTQHRMQFVNILYSDGHTKTCSNTEGRFTVDAHSDTQVCQTFDVILRIFERADAEP